MKKYKLNENLILIHKKLKESICEYAKPNKKI